jgi:hypothetical protein
MVDQVLTVYKNEKTVNEIDKTQHESHHRTVLRSEDLVTPVIDLLQPLTPSVRHATFQGYATTYKEIKDV